MIARWDFAVMFAVAAGVHVAGFGYYASTGGFEGAGADGRAVISLEAAPEGIAALVAAWDAVPEVSVSVTEMDAPVGEADFVKMDVWGDGTVVSPSPKLAELPEVAVAPVVSVVSGVLPMAYNVSGEVSGVTARVDTVAVAVAPGLAVPDAAPTGFEAPARVDPVEIASVRPTARPVQREASAAVVARGTGGGVSAGNLGEKRVVATLAPAARQAAQAAWAATIQARIARHQRYPRGTRGAGRVRLEIDILADGQLGAVRVDRSSGVAAFDRAALQAAKAAAPFPAAPKGLDRARFAFAQWVTFAR